MVPSLPGRVTPDAACGVPITGGQKVVQLPLHFELVGVSMANQYRVNPLESVRTVPRLVFAVFSIAVDDEPWLLWLGAAAAGVPLEELPEELPQAASRTVNTTNAGSIHLR